MVEVKLKLYETCDVKITAAQDELPSSSLANSRVVISRGKQINPPSSSRNSRNSWRVIYVPRFVIRVNFSVHVCPASDASNQLKIRSITREIRIPCSALTSTSTAVAKKILSSKFSGWRIPLPVNGGAMFMKKHYGEHFSGCPDADEDDDWVEEFQDFLRCVRRKSYNLGHSVIPVSLNIDRLRPTSDFQYFETVLWFTRQRLLLPNFAGTWRAMLSCYRPYPGEGECPICLQPLNWDSYISLSCSHCFHDSCIVKWLRRNPSCPVCRCKFGD